MSGQEYQIQQILVALDSSPGSITALKEAIMLAAGFKAEVLGVYVEDINLVRLANISFTQEVGLFSATTRRLEVQYIERQFRGQAGRVRRALATLAKQAGIDWKFQVVRGVVTKELLSAASEADLIVLGRMGLSPVRRKRMGSTARAVLLQSSRLTLVLHPGERLGTPITIIYDGSKVAQRALVVAARWVPGDEEPLNVILLTTELSELKQLEKEAKSKLKDRGLSARYLWHSITDTPGLINKIQQTRCQMLVIPSDGSRLDSEVVLMLLEELECPALLVR